MRARTLELARSMLFSAATSAIRSGYVGVQQMTVTLLSRIIWRRAPVERPPVGIQRWPMEAADSKAAQKPMKGPKEKVKMKRSAGSMAMAEKMIPQQR